MTDGEQTIRALRQALETSPDNLPLWQYFCETLAGLGRHPEAEREFKAGLARWPEDLNLKVGLARSFEQQGKHSAALVVVEELLKLSRAPAKAYVLHARLLLHAGDAQRAVRQYRRGIEEDPSVADSGLADRLGVRANVDLSSEDVPDEVVDGRVRAAWEAPSVETRGEIERPRIAFRDVGGMESVKEEIRMRIIHPLNHPELYKAYGKAIGGGVLMYGPPGCGKTYLARATAGEINAGFLPVGINDVLDMWIGNSERNLHALFEQARRNRPCVLFFGSSGFRVGSP